MAVSGANLQANSGRTVGSKMRIAPGGVNFVVSAALMCFDVGL